MISINLDDDLLLRAGIGIGYAFAPFFRGLLQGIEDYEIESAAMDIQGEIENQEYNQESEAKGKTNIQDCRQCWCDQCEKLEQCTKSRDNVIPNINRPFPCIGCIDGERFRPLEKEKCNEFIQGKGVNNG